MKRSVLQHRRPDGGYLLDLVLLSVLLGTVEWLHAEVERRHALERLLGETVSRD
jgi:hypothetical protein